MARRNNYENWKNPDSKKYFFVNISKDPLELNKSFTFPNSS